MSIIWEQQAYDDHYNIRIRWAGPSDLAAPDYDPLNTGEIAMVGDPPVPTLMSRIGERVHYGIDLARYAQRGIGPYSYYLDRAARINSALMALGVARTARMMLVGSEYGYTIWALRNASRHPDMASDYPNVFGVDKSAYIEANYVETDTNLVAQRIDDVGIVFADWLDNDTKSVQDDLDAVTGGHAFDVVINGVTESFQLDGGGGVAELAAFNAHLDACETGLAGADLSRIVHLVDTFLPDGKTIDDPEYATHKTYGTTIRTLPNWAAVRPTHSWLHMATGEFIAGVSA